jgi:hypothetical protein
MAYALSRVAVRLNGTGARRRRLVWSGNEDVGVDASGSFRYTVQ